MINSQETQSHCRGKKDNETVYYVELEGKKTERAYLKFTKRPGGGKTMCKSPHQAEGPQ